MTVEELQTMHEIQSTTPDTVEQLGWVICALFGKTHDEVNAWPVWRFRFYVWRIDRALRAKPRRWAPKLQTNAAEITFGQFIDCQHFLKNGTIESLDLVAARLSERKGNHAAEAKRLRGKHFAAILAQVETFVESLNSLIKSYPGLFEIDEPDPDEELKPDETPQFIERYGWLYSAEQVALYLRVETDAVLDLPILRALNALAYLKGKARYEKSLIKK